MAIRPRTPAHAPLPMGNQVFKRSFREQVFTLLRSAYDQLDAPSFQGAEETAITGELCEAVRGIIESDTAPSWAWRFSVHDDPPVERAGKSGRSRPRLDIILERSQKGAHPRYCFESKRLCKGKYAEAWYLGEEGLGAFLMGTYAADQDEAGMIAYVQSDTTAHWEGRVSAALAKQPDRHAVVDGKWEAVVSPAGTYCSRHLRRNRSTIDVYHLFLGFC